jgi:phosphoglycerate dehydrogenase-like enzyme
MDELKEKYDIDVIVEEVCTDLTDVDLLLATRLDKQVLHTADKLKALFIPFTGMNKFPLDELKERNVSIINTHGKAPIVAERALALTLSLMGKIVTYHESLRDEGRWLTREFWGTEFWNSLYHKKVGIIGMGNIGQAIIKLLNPFDVEIINLSRDVNKNLADKYVDELDDLLKECDLLYITCELNAETTGLINSDNIHLLKGKFLINIARGQVVDEKVLYQALKDNVLAGAGLDVWYQYPVNNTKTFPSIYPIHTLSNVVLSPHASCHAEEAKHDYYIDIFNKIEDMLV